MIPYRHIELADKTKYDAILSKAGERGCEYSFTNLYLWGRQRIAFEDGTVSVFSQFDRKSVYLFPVGSGELKTTLDKIMHDASVRDIPCRLTGLSEQECQLLENLYPGKFRFHNDRNNFDYIYSIDALADLSGKKLQRKRNHCNRFWQQYPNASIEPITEENTIAVQQMVDCWYEAKLQEDSTGDFHMERAAIHKALTMYRQLDMEGLALRVDGNIVAMTLGSRLPQQTFDVHFEKALNGYDGAYAVINREFAAFLRNKYPEIKWLNREEDMGLEGLRKAKLSYYPDRLREKYWACLLEDGYDY